MLGLGIPASVTQLQNVTVAFGNPFDSTACIVRDGRYIMVDITRPIYQCDKCSMAHPSHNCPLPPFKMASVHYYIVVGDKSCPICYKTFLSTGGLSNH